MNPPTINTSRIWAVDFMRDGRLAAATAFVILVFRSVILHADDLTARHCGVLLFPAKTTPGQINPEVVDDFARVMVHALASLTGAKAVDPAQIRVNLPTETITSGGMPSIETFRGLLDDQPFEVLLVGQVSGTSQKLNLHLVRVSDERLLDREWIRTDILGAHDAVKQLQELAAEAVTPGPTVLTVEVRGVHTARVEVDNLLVVSGTHHRLAVDEGIRSVKVIFPDLVESTQQTRCRKGRLCSVVFERTHASDFKDPVVDESPSSTQIGAWTMVAVAIAATGTGIGFGLHTTDLERKLRERCPYGNCTSSRTSVTEIEDEGRTAALVSTMLFATGAAAAGTALILFLVEADTPSTTLRGSPLLLPTGGAGVGASLQF